MRTVHSMTFEDAQFIYDNMSEEYPDENEVEQDYEPDLEDDD